MCRSVYLCSSRGGGDLELILQGFRGVKNLNKESHNSNIKHHYKNTKGFTLAEVLITLGIIGIVAAMTMPSLINSFKAKALENQFKKSNSVLQQALKNSVFEIGYGDITEFNIPGRQVTTENFSELKENVEKLNEVWVKQFVDAKKLDRVTLQRAKKYCYNIIGTRLASGEMCFFQAGDNGTYILPNGMLVSKLFAQNGGTNHPGNIRFVFDTNGPYKGPNRYGHDIFIYDSVSNYNTECNPIRGTSHSNEGCYSWANRNVDPIDNSKPYWNMLFKPESYFK